MKARVFNIMQYEYHPIDAYDENGNLIANANPLITEEQIIDGLNHRTIKQWAYIRHDSDVYSEKDEANDTTGRIRAGATKPPHYHIVLSCPSQVELSAVAKWFEIPENFIDIPKGKGAFLDCVEYLTHERPEQQALGKTLYPSDKVIASEGFDWRAEIDARNIRRIKYGHNADGMNASEMMKMHVLRDGWTMKQCRDHDPLTYIKVRDSLPKLRLDYLSEQPPCPFRMNIYVEGPGGVGKNSYCEYIAQQMFPDVENVCFSVGNDARVAFDGYDGQPVIIWDDWRAYQFYQTFGRGGTFNIFDTHPKNQAQQAKNTHIILTNAVNIVNGVEPYIEFMDGLAGSYTDKHGVRHEAEDKNQSYRRFPMILCVREGDFDVLFNKGFVDKESWAYNQYSLYNNVCGSIKNVMTKLEGSAKEQTLIAMTEPVMDCYHMIEDSHDEKISDPALIPEEFRNYGRRRTAEEVASDAEKNAIESAIKKTELELHDLGEYVKFCEEWVAVNAEELVAGTKQISHMASFEEWCAYGHYTHYDSELKEWV